MKTLAIVGGGASGMLAGITALETNPDIQVIIFDQKDILSFNDKQMKDMRFSKIWDF